MEKSEILFKRKRKVKLVMLLVLIYVCTAFIPVSAASRDVTKKYKKEVTNILSGIGTYLEITSGKSLYFKYDAYAKTTMACLKYGEDQIYDQPEMEVKKAVLPLLKQYFNTSVFKIRNYEQSEVYKIASSYVYRDDPNIKYLRGDWGLWYPSGKVTKIVQSSAKQYVATYTVNWYDRTHLNQPSKKRDCIGVYKIYLQKKGNGFIITNIKRTYQKK